MISRYKDDDSDWFHNLFTSQLDKNVESIYFQTFDSLHSNLKRLKLDEEVLNNLHVS